MLLNIFFLKYLGNDYLANCDYKYRKQKYLLELDKESVNLNTKEKIQEKYNKFFKKLSIDTEKHG